MAIGSWLKKGAMFYVAFLILAGALIAATLGEWLYAGGLLLAAAVAYYYVDERKEAESAADTAQRVGDRVSNLTGGLLSWTQALVLSGFAIVLSLGGQFFDLVDLVVQLVNAAPVTAGTLGIGAVLAYFDWNGTIGLQLSEWAVIVVALTVIGVLARRALYGRVQT